QHPVATGSLIYKMDRGPALQNFASPSRESCAFAIPDRKPQRSGRSPAGPERSAGVAKRLDGPRSGGYSGSSDRSCSLIEPRQFESRKFDRPDPVVDRLEADTLASERFAEEDLSVAEFDVSLRRDQPHLQMQVVLRCHDLVRIWTRRRFEVLERHIKTECLVRTLLVVDPAEGVEALLLEASVRGRRPCRGCGQCRVHPFMRSVL